MPLKEQQPQLGPRTHELLGLLNKIAAQLRACGEEHWQRWMEKDAALIRRGDLRGVEHFADAFGGIGHVNDLGICQGSGHSVEPDRVHVVNSELDRFRGEAWALAKGVLREAATD